MICCKKKKLYLGGLIVIVFVDCYLECATWKRGLSFLEKTTVLLTVHKSERLINAVICGRLLSNSAHIHVAPLAFKLGLPYNL
jgi:hypothetical protein